MRFCGEPIQMLLHTTYRIRRPRASRRNFRDRLRNSGLDCRGDRRRRLETRDARGARHRGRGVPRDCVEGAQRPQRRRRGDTSARRGAARCARLPPPRGRQAERSPDRARLPRAPERVVDGDHPRRRGRRVRARDEHRAHRERLEACPADDWLEGVIQRRPAGIILVFSELPATMRGALAARGIPFVIIDPAGDPPVGVRRSRARTERRTRRDAAPHLPRPSAHRGDSAARTT